MNDIEQLVRDSLKSAPTPPTRVADPVPTIERRAARARAFIAGGAVVAVAVVTAAIVVPLQLVDRTGGPSRVGPLASAPPSTPASAVNAPRQWAGNEIQSLTAGGGALWSLRPHPNSNSGQMDVERLDPVSHARTGTWTVDAPVTWMSYGLGRVWLTGGGDGAYPDGSLQVVDPASGSVHALTSVHQQLSDVAFAAGHAWVIDGRSVWEVDPNGAHVGTVTLPTEATQTGIVATDSGQLWVRTPKTWLRIDPATRRVVDTVQWSWQMLGAAGGDAIWTDEGGSRLIALVPAFLHQGQSVAEDVRIQLPGPPSAVARSSDGGLFVLASDEPDPASGALTLYYLSKQQLSGPATVDDKTPSVPGGSPLAADAAGGVNYLTSDGAMHWTP